MTALKKYILSVMLVLLSVSLVSAESEIERQVRIGHIRIGHIEFGTTLDQSGYDENRPYLKNDLSKLACVHCKKVGSVTAGFIPSNWCCSKCAKYFIIKKGE